MNKQPGPVAEAMDADNVIKSFNLFISEEIISIITMNTNKNIVNFHNMLSEEQQEKLATSDKYTHLRVTDEIEMTALIGLFYLRGTLQQNNWAYRNIFKHMIGHPAFASTMSFNRFGFLNSMISFDDASTRTERWKSDRFAAAREIFEIFNDNCSKALQAGPYMAIDECLYSCRNQVSLNLFFVTLANFDEKSFIFP